MKRFCTFTLAAFFAALFIFAGSASADCPETDPRCTILPPVSQEVGSSHNAVPMTAGEANSITLVALNQIVPMPPPPMTATQIEEIISPSFETMSLPMRRQDPSDPTCGVQALGMALDGLPGSAPSSAAILEQLQDHGYFYSFGTGAEELAFTAREFGYLGSVSFHDWNLEALRNELSAGRPVILDLGANGFDQPGHFVTLTGISDDWNWVAVNDPLLGKRVLSLAEFMRLWDLQGNSGVTLAEAPPAPDNPGYATWMAFGAAMMASLALGPTLLADYKRRGTGGGLNPGVIHSTGIPDQTRIEGPPPTTNPLIVRVPYIERVVVGQKVIGRHLEKVTHMIPAYREVISPGCYEVREKMVPYTAYRPKSILVEKIVNVTRKVTEKVTSWVQQTVVKPVKKWVKKTITTPVTRWVRKTRTWFERTWLGRLVRKTRTWLEKKATWVRKTVWTPVTQWVREKVLTPVTQWVTRTIVKPVKKLVEEIVMEPYTAYRKEQVQVYVPPETRYIPAHEETRNEWVEETEPIVREEIRWREVPVNAGMLPYQVAQDFFNQVDPGLSQSEQLALFQRFRDSFGAFIDSDASQVDVLSQMAFELFFNGVSDAGSEVLMDNWKMTSAYTLRLRSEPGTGSTLAYVPYGAYLRWTSESQQVDGTTWHQVQYYANGKLVEGWVSSDYLTEYVPGSSQAMLDFQMDTIFAEHGVDLDGDWNLRDKRAAAVAIEAVAERFAGVLGVSKDQAFGSIMSELTLLWGTEPEAGDYLTGQCKGIDAGGCTSSAHMINFGSLWSTGPYRPEDIAFQASVNNVVHELGHAFANLWWGSDEGPYAELNLPGSSQLLSNEGFFVCLEAAKNMWRQHREENPTPNEVFADMFLGWVYSQWEDLPEGDRKSQYMEASMPKWLEDAFRTD